MTFTQWLRTKRKDDNAIGDLARDAAQDRGWPRDGSTLERFQARLNRAGACYAALETLKRAWKEYQKEKGEN